MEYIAIGVSIFGVLGTLAGVLFALGKRDAKLDALEGRCREEWERNSRQHSEFYMTRDTVTRIDTKFDDIARRMENMEDDVKEILSRLPKEA